MHNFVSSIRKRDELVLSMIDSLMPPTMRENDVLTAEDKNLVAKEEQEENVIENVKTTIKDNIKFMQVTSLKAGRFNSNTTTARRFY